MDFIQIICETSLPHPAGLKYKGIAFDGCYYYLTCPDNCEIVKYNSQFCQAETICTRNSYTCICFDPDRNCFWAGSAKCPHKLFKLDLCFREIDCISLPYCECCEGVVTAVSYDCKRKKLLICCTKGVLLLNPDAPAQYELLPKFCAVCNMQAISVAPSYLTMEHQHTKKFICVYDDDLNLLCKYEIPCAYVVEAIAFSPCTTHCNKQPHFHLLVTKNGCYPYLLEFTLPDCELEIGHCNYAVCHRNCGHCAQPEHACADLMESVALIEAALSHILNAEGEKLQKIIATTDDVDKILCVNRSIQETIVNVTHLEIILHDKLAAINECCGGCEANECCDTGESCECCDPCSPCDPCNPCESKGCCDIC